MNWQDYFEDWAAEYYESDDSDLVHEVMYRYKDQSVTKLPDNLPMPPTTDMNGLFSNCSSLKDISALSNWDTGKVTTMAYMFHGCEKLQDIGPLSNWDTSKVTRMDSMFGHCCSLQDISALSNWNISNIKNTKNMFHGCILLPSYLQASASHIEKYIHKYDLDEHKKETNQQITALQKENTELKTRLTYLEEKMDNVMSQFSAPTKT